MSPPPLVAPLPGTAAPVATLTRLTLPPPRVDSSTAPALSAEPTSELSVATVVLSTTFVARFAGFTPTVYGRLVRSTEAMST